MRLIDRLWNWWHPRMMWLMFFVFVASYAHALIKYDHPLDFGPPRIWDIIIIVLLVGMTRK